MEILISEKTSWEAARNNSLSSPQTTSSADIMVSDGKSRDRSKSIQLSSPQAKSINAETTASDKSLLETAKKTKTAGGHKCSLVVCRELALEGRTRCQAHSGTKRTPWWLKSAKSEVTEPVIPIVAEVKKVMKLKPKPKPKPKPKACKVSKAIDPSQSLQSLDIDCHSAVVANTPKSRTIDEYYCASVHHAPDSGSGC